VDTDALLVSQPDTGEQALEIADMLIRSSAIDVVVIDSVAALVPRAEIEGEMGDTHVGLQARLMSQALRKLAGALNQTKTTAIFINSCARSASCSGACRTRQRSHPDRRHQGRSARSSTSGWTSGLSDPETDRCPRKIVNWFSNGKTDVSAVHRSHQGRTGRLVRATENHLIHPGGWRPAGELLPGDRVLVAEQQLLGAQQVQVILGSLMGDGALSPNLRGRSGTRFRLGHGPKQAAYLNWKVSLLENIPHCRTSNAKGAVFADFTPLPELGEMREIVYFGDGKKHLTWDYLKSLTPLALAVWYMDDGCFTVRSKGVQERTRGGTGRIDYRRVEERAGQCRSRHSSGRLPAGCEAHRPRSAEEERSSVHHGGIGRVQKLIAPYVHPSMEYKLLPRFRGRFAVRPEFAPAKTRPVPAQVLDVHVKPRTRSMSRFDIEVEGSHSYFVDGVMVHNSPETTSGGRALKFYSSSRLDVRRIETLKDGTDAVGNRTRVKVVKNKQAPPFKTAEFDILFGFGISREGGLIDLGVEQAIVRKSGAWYTYEGDQLGQGKENARNFLRDNPDLANEIEKKIKEKLGVGPRLDVEAADKEPAAGAGGLRAVPNEPANAAGAPGGQPATRLGGGPGGAG
jgi:recombination protein RecA